MHEFADRVCPRSVVQERLTRLSQSRGETPRFRGSLTSRRKKRSFRIAIPIWPSNLEQAMVVRGLTTAMLFDSTLPLRTEVVEAQTILLGVDQVEQHVSEADPLCRLHLALEDGVLHPKAEPDTGLCDSRQASLPAGSDSADIVADQDEHRYRQMNAG